MREIKRGKNGCKLLTGNGFGFVMLHLPKRLNRFSKPLLSTTQPPLRCFWGLISTTWDPSHYTIFAFFALQESFPVPDEPEGAKRFQRQMSLVEQIEAFLKGNEEVGFQAPNRKELYEWTQATLCAQGYISLHRSGKGLVRQYISKVTGSLEILEIGDAGSEIDQINLCGRRRPL
jgi:hypothetical protein